MLGLNALGEYPIGQLFEFPSWIVDIEPSISWELRQEVGIGFLSLWGDSDNTCFLALWGDHTGRLALWGDAGQDWNITTPNSTNWNVKEIY